MFRRFDIDLSPFVDNDIYLWTLRVKGRFSREEALKRLNNAGVAPSDIMGMYREGENSRGVLSSTQGNRLQTLIHHKL
ncbi:hypothetical protein ACJMK2_039956, partial [Sinanodonta woodiana]